MRNGIMSFGSWILITLGAMGFVSILELIKKKIIHHLKKWNRNGREKL